MIYDIINIPHVFPGGDKSFYTLLSDTGYFENPDGINEINIEKALLEYPNAINEWIEYLTMQTPNKIRPISKHDDFSTNIENNRAVFNKYKSCAINIIEQISCMRLLYIKKQEKLKIVGVKTISRIIHDVLSIPDHLVRLQNKTFIELLVSVSGYMDNADLINENNIKQILRMQPTTINSWLNFSTSKHAKRFFYFDDIINEYIITTLPNNIFTRKYSDKFVACAKYIDHEITMARLKFIYIH